MNLARLLENLKALPADAPLVFHTQEGEIGAGYHVTEFKLGKMRSIDCGARLDEWTDATLQLLDGSGDQHMTAGKFYAIAAQSVAKLDGLGSAPLRVEFAHGNRGMRVYELSVPELAGHRVQIRLSEHRSRCKPAFESDPLPADTRCCSGDTVTSCCA